MESYEIIKEVGDGTFGNVWRAINLKTGEVVAIKKMKKKFYTWEECLNLIEVKALRKIKHPNIVQLKEVIRENDTLYFVFEYMECDLYQMMMGRGQKLLPETQVRSWCFQVFLGLAYMHQNGYFHRDLKPENLLVSKDIIKIADFGLAREIGSNFPYTEYVTTRWYRAPEVILRASTYYASVDMWAMGAIMAELFTLYPLFPGSSEADQIGKICSVIGSPTNYSWAEGLHLAKAMNYQFPQLPHADLSTLIPSASDDAVSLIRSLCSWDPRKRPTALEALQHPFFQSCFYVPPSLQYSDTVTKTPSEKCAMRYFARAISRPSGNMTLTTGVQQKLEMNERDAANKYQCLKKLAKLSKYEVYDNQTAKMGTYGVSDAVDKLRNMSIGYGRPSVRQQTLAPATGVDPEFSRCPLVAGLWHGPPGWIQNNNPVKAGLWNNVEGEIGMNHGLNAPNIWNRLPSELLSIHDESLLPMYRTDVAQHTGWHVQSDLVLRHSRAGFERRVAG